jgi:hypothetical protein
MKDKPFIHLSALLLGLFSIFSISSFFFLRKKKWKPVGRIRWASEGRKRGNRVIEGAWICLCRTLAFVEFHQPAIT